MLLLVPKTKLVAFETITPPFVIVPVTVVTPALKFTVLPYLPNPVESKIRFPAIVFVLVEEMVTIIESVAATPVAKSSVQPVGIDNAVVVEVSVNVCLAPVND